MGSGRIRGAVLVCLVVGLGGRPGVGGALSDRRADVHSFSRPDRVRVTRLSLNLKVDFTKKQIEGSATLTVRRQPGCPVGEPLILDTRGLSIEKVTTPREGGNDAPVVPFRVGAEAPILGAPLSIDLPADATVVRVDYHTTGKSSALQWLDPKGTAGGRQPFLFTQSEAIHARSWIPLQDTPGVRMTYAASVRVPEGLTAVMSADRVAARDDVPSTYGFEMPEPIPSYLIALAVGDLAFRPLGPRTGVFAEPSVVEKAAREFADTAAMVSAVERRYGPYRWGRYDLLVLPPSFPFGGMENPKLTFATPTVLAGDRSLVSLVAHELAHSWSGNLVTNATWRDFWLNEGFTTYLERRVMEDLYGPGRADMERLLGMRELRQELAVFPKRDQVLHIDLAGRDPDEGMTRIPYEKGALFLTAVEKAVGRVRFDAYLRGYFDRFAFRSITTADFVADLRKNLLDDSPAGGTIDLHAWLEAPGLPPDAPEPSSDRLARVERAARDWASGTTPADRLDTAGWSTQEWVHFLRSLPEKIAEARLAGLDRAFGLTGRGNAEVAQQWLVIAVRNQYRPAETRLDDFLTTIGRRKFLMPLYAELLKTPEGSARARTIYARARPFYHPIAAESVDRLMKGAKAE